MSRFQSQIMNWLDRSLPVQWGRQARRSLQQWLTQRQSNAAPRSPRTITYTYWQGLLRARRDAQPLTGRPAVPALPPWRFLLMKQAFAQLKQSQSWDRLLELIAAAIAYFARQPKPKRLDGNPDPNWLDPPDFRGDCPQIMPGRAPLWAPIPEEPDLEPTPMYAWIDTHATFLGYAYGPVMTLIYWLDRWLARLERLLLRFWRWLTTYKSF
ncbi:MAG: hypothetical protein HC919_10055 [Oscillatoriales cyanobacterium SM2_2_1]|nr:hypothetical protein [Oscillatoriales cyanobacterium SM2_2_1]